jgi:hypothetical protein
MTPEEKKDLEAGVDRLFAEKRAREAKIDMGVPLSAREFAKLGHSQHVRWLLGGILPERAITVLSGPEKAGKTTLLMHIMEAMSEGRDTFLGQPLRRAKTFVISQEPPAVWGQRAEEYHLDDDQLKVATGRDGRLQPFYGRLNLDQWRALILEIVPQVKDHGFELVVFDIASDFWPVRDVFSPVEYPDVFMPLRLIAEAGAGVLLLVHSNKRSHGGIDDITASGELAGQSDHVMTYSRIDTKNTDDTRRRLTAIGRLSGRGSKGTEWLLDWDGKNYEILAEGHDAIADVLRSGKTTPRNRQRPAKPGQQPAGQVILNHVKLYECLDEKALMERTQIKRSTLRDALTKLQQTGTFIKEDASEPHQWCRGKRAGT